MGIVTEQEALTADTASTKAEIYKEKAPQKEEAPVEERTDLTIEEAEELADGRSFELIDGRMVLKMGDKKHSRCQGYLIGKFFVYFEKNPIGQVLPEFSFRPWPENKRNWRTPDIAVFLNENLHEGEKYEPRAPDLAIEIVSDDDRAAKIFAKARLYLEKGSKVVWIVFPSEESVVVMTPTERRWESATLTCPEILPDFSLDAAEIFSWPKQQPSPATEEAA
ncbi:MAG: Uma2 family endonuclease [bacterium]